MALDPKMVERAVLNTVDRLALELAFMTGEPLAHCRHMVLQAMASTMGAQ
jgi:hypothetical protein